jgi:hypothetical protein
MDKVRPYSGNALTARWVFDQPQTPNRDSDGGSDRKRKVEDTPCGINLQFV